MRRLNGIVWVFLLVEFIDELTYGAGEAAWPLIRHDLGLSYTQIGLLLSVPNLFGSMVEPALGILGDTRWRRTVVLTGGVVFAITLAGVAGAWCFAVMLSALLLHYPASGGFVNLVQAELMDLAPDRRDQNMARWTAAGSLGVVVGPLVLGGACLIGSGWRGVFLGLAVASAAAVALSARVPFHRDGQSDEEQLGLRRGLVEAVSALRRGEVIRWLVLIQFSDLMLDVLFSLLALYFVDVVGLSPAQATIAVSAWTVTGLLGDLLLIPLVERVNGLAYLRVSAVVELLLFVAFLLMPIPWLKLVLVGLLGMLNAGWYAILKARLYGAMPGRSGTVMAVSNLGGWLGSLMPLGLGIAAQHWGLGPAMWLLIAGPVALLVGLPRRRLGKGA